MNQYTTAYIQKNISSLVKNDLPFEIVIRDKVVARVFSPENDVFEELRKTKEMLNNALSELGSVTPIEEFHEETKEEKIARLRNLVADN